MGLMENSTTKAVTTQSIEQSMLQHVPKGKEKDFQKIIAAGMKVMFDPQTNKLALDAIAGDDKPEDIGRAVADLIMLLGNQSQGTMPIDVAVPAASVLAAHALDFAEKAGMGVKFDNETYARTVKALYAYFMQKLGIDPAKMQQAAQAKRKGVR